MTIDTLTREAAVERMVECQERMEQIGGKHRASKTEEVEFGQLGDEFDQLQRHVEKLDRAASIAAVARGGAGDLRMERRPDSDRRNGGLRDSAMRQLERSVKAGLPAAGAEVVERLVDNGPEHERSWAARWVTDTGSADYKSAFAKLVAYGEARAGLEWTGAERAAYDRVSRLKQEQRAMSLTDSAGGFLVPFEIDFSVNIVNAGSINPLVQISRVVQSVTDVWHGVSSAGVTASWDAEASEVSDDSPTFAEPTIPNYKAAAFVPFSIELAGDAEALVGEIGKLVNDGILQLLNAALTTGSGTGTPTGIITSLLGGSSVVATGTADTLVANDVYSVQNALGPRWQAQARWCANLAILNTLRQMETANGALLFPELRASEPTLLGRPVHELSNMQGTMGGGAGNDPVLLYGDFSNFVVSHRIGASVEFIPHLFGSNQRPTGQRGMYAYARYGSDSVNDAAFRLLVA